MPHQTRIQGCLRDFYALNHPHASLPLHHWLFPRSRILNQPQTLLSRFSRHYQLSIRLFHWQQTTIHTILPGTLSRQLRKESLQEMPKRLRRESPCQTRQNTSLLCLQNVCCQNGSPLCLYTKLRRALQPQKLLLASLLGVPLGSFDGSSDQSQLHQVQSLSLPP